MLTIRMQRTGRSGHAMFRVIVQDSRFSPTSGKVVANLGSYDPHAKTTTLDKAKAEGYLKNGAQPSGRVARLLKSEGVKLPSWVNISDEKKREIRHPEKRRSTRPPEPEQTESPAEAAESAPSSDEAVAEAASAEPEAPTESATVEAPAEAEEAEAPEEASPSEESAEAVSEEPAESPAADSPAEEPKAD
ncbi:MAG TPA: 30S ribosomal protein S16 [Candidatus Saccharimonadales bacterium]|nr:30S ribosomal protein S16 [Candidatus Saccharimonadales bacterium]